MGTIQIKATIEVCYSNVATVLAELAEIEHKYGYHENDYVDSCYSSIPNEVYDKEAELLFGNQSKENK